MADINYEAEYSVEVIYKAFYITEHLYSALYEKEHKYHAYYQNELLYPARYENLMYYDADYGLMMPYYGGEGTKDYNVLDNKPQINDVILIGNKMLPDIGVDTMSILDIAHIFD